MAKKKSPAYLQTARGSSALALTRAAEHFPDLTAEPAQAFENLPDARERKLAMAIYRAAMQRWLTLEYLLEGYLDKPAAKLEPAMRGVLMCGAAQLVLMQGMPSYAVVDEMVQLARQMVRPGAAGLANAVLRRVAELVGKVEDVVWQPAEDVLPLERGIVRLGEACLPEAEDFSMHMSIATSHPWNLVQSWLTQTDAQRTQALCLHGLFTPPTIVAVEPEFDYSGASDDTYQKHARDGFVVWEGDRKELVQFLDAHPARRVQDPASATPAESTRALSPKLIVDYCAGRGTKTRQLAALHPEAQIIATDISDDRRKDLARAAAALPQVKVLTPQQVQQQFKNQVDLLVLDVPCSNTGVLARRPEARYRYNADSLRSVTNLQRQIMQQTSRLPREGSHVLYATCSIEAVENQEQAHYLAQTWKGEIEHEALVWPDGPGTTYCDGSYHALIRR